MKEVSDYPSRRMLGLGLIASLGVACQLGCGAHPREELIVAPRVLALRTEIVESWLPSSDPVAPYRATILPFDKVRIRPYLVSPQGEIDPTTWSWAAVICPDHNRGCPFYDPEILPCAVEVPDSPRALLLADPTDVNFSRSCVSVPPPGELPTVVLPSPRNTFFDVMIAGVRRDWRLAITLVGSPAMGPGAAKCSQYLRDTTADLPQDCVFTQASLPFGPEEVIKELLARANAGNDELPELIFRDETTALQEHPQSLIELNREIVGVEMQDAVTRESDGWLKAGAEFSATLGSGWIASLIGHSLFSDFPSTTSPGYQAISDEPTGAAGYYTTFGYFDYPPEGGPKVWHAAALPGDSPANIDELQYLFLVDRPWAGTSSWLTVPVRLVPKK